MIGCFPNCRLAVVTTEAGADDHAVVDPQHDREAEGRVTRIAGIGGADVGNRFPNRIAVVMARQAGPSDAAMVEHRSDEGCGGMAIIATGPGGYVLDRFGGGADRRAAFMTTGAIGRGALEDAADVACFAGGPLMGPGEGKTGQEMVEINLSGSLR